MDGDDALSLSMFWAGLLMVFTPLLFAGTVIGVAWRQRVRLRRKGQETADSTSVQSTVEAIGRQ